MSSFVASGDSQEVETSVIEQVVFAFNQVFIDLVKDVKSKDRSLGHIIKKGYSCLDRKSDEYIAEWAAAIGGEEGEAAWAGAEDLLSDEVVRGAEVVRGISVGDMAIAVDAAEHATLARYLYTLFVLSRVRSHVVDADPADARMIVLVVAGLGSASTVEDERCKAVLVKLAALKKKEDDEVPETPQAPPTSSAGLGGDAFFEDSRIGQLAREITSKIDMSSIASQRPEDLMNMQNLFSGSNSAITNIIQQVGSTITEKIQSGELKQEELVADAMALMSKMNLGGMMGGANGGPSGNMMKNMMSMFGNMAPPRPPRKGREGREDVRSRLQKKMASRAPNQAGGGQEDSSFTE